MFALRLRVFSVLPRALEALRPETHIDFGFCIGAISEHLPDEAAGMALFENCDHFFACYAQLA